MGRQVFSQTPSQPESQSQSHPHSPRPTTSTNIRRTSSSQQKYLPARPDNAPDASILTTLLYPHNRELRGRLLEFLKQPLFARRYDLSVAQQRELTNQRIHALVRAGFYTATLTGSSRHAARKYSMVVETIGLVDHSLEVKSGVTFGLFGATVRALGNDEQKTYWLPKIESGEQFGCFALTELGHGSNVRGIETIATYDKQNDDFIIHTPTESAQKYWIGGAAQSATVCVAFAKLYVDGKNHGIHVFIVKLRHSIDNAAVMNGVEIRDCGCKIGLNGVDNGRIWFTNCRIPKSSMLTKLSHVNHLGEFKASIPSPDARFAKILAALTGGRISIASMAIKSSMLALNIAIRYSITRTAFSPSPDSLEEVPLLFYKSQQRNLIIPLAQAFVYYFCATDLNEQWALISAEGHPLTKQLHLESAGYKALFTWFMQHALQASREACGGQGYKSDNEIAHLKADRDVMMTFEGANAVLLQQIGKQLIQEFSVAQKENNGRFTKSSPLFILNHQHAPSIELVESEAETDHILSTNFIFNALWKREKALVIELFNTYQKAMKNHHNHAFFAWNDCLGIAEKAAVAHMHRRIFENSQTHIQKAQLVGGHCAHALILCRRLWAASVIDKYSDFLRCQSVSRDQATNVANAIDDLCEQVTAIADDLLKGIDYPQHILAPIAGDWVNHNSRAML